LSRKALSHKLFLATYYSGSTGEPTHRRLLPGAELLPLVVEGDGARRAAWSGTPSCWTGPPRPAFPIMRAGGWRSTNMLPGRSRTLIRTCGVAGRQNPALQQGVVNGPLRVLQ
jgi:hypothetical protein